MTCFVFSISLFFFHWWFSRGQPCTPRLCLSFPCISHFLWEVGGIKGAVSVCYGAPGPPAQVAVPSFSFPSGGDEAWDSPCFLGSACIHPSVFLGLPGKILGCVTVGLMWHRAPRSAIRGPTFPFHCSPVLWVGAFASFPLTPNFAAETKLQPNPLCFGPGLQWVARGFGETGKRTSSRVFRGAVVWKVGALLFLPTAGPFTLSLSVSKGWDVWWQVLS